MLPSSDQEESMQSLFYFNHMNNKEHWYYEKTQFEECVVYPTAVNIYNMYAVASNARFCC